MILMREYCKRDIEKKYDSSKIIGSLYRPFSPR